MDETRFDWAPNMEEKQTSPFHVFHKVPTGDGLYVRAKHVQLLEKDPKKAIALFGAALEAGDRVDSALKDMAIVLKQQNRPQDAILAIQTFRTRCSDSAQDSLDNVLLDLYRICGRLDEQIALLIRKLELLNRCQSFNGKRTKTARSQGKKMQVSVEQETGRLLGNLGWAYMLQSDHAAAEHAYRRALALEVDNNKVCNLGVCLMKQGRADEAMEVLKRASYLHNKSTTWESHLKSYRRAQELMRQASSMWTQIRRFPSADEVDSNAGGDVSSPCTASIDSSLDSPWRQGMQIQQQHPSDGVLEQAFARSSTCHTEGQAVHDERSHECPHIKLSGREEAWNMRRMVAAAGVRAWKNDAQGRIDGGRNSEVTRRQACEEDDTSPVYHQTINEECSLRPPTPCLLAPSPSSDHLVGGSAQGRRPRLPVFRAITVLRSAAA